MPVSASPWWWSAERMPGATRFVPIQILRDPLRRPEIAFAGIAALVAGALSMAAGEYVSVSSQRDSEVADLARERRELAADPEGELRELALIYEARGLKPTLAREVAEQLSR